MHTGPQMQTANAGGKVVTPSPGLGMDGAGAAGTGSEGSGAERNGRTEERSTARKPVESTVERDAEAEAEAEAGTEDWASGTALKDLAQLHEAIGRREKELEASVEAARQQVLACFGHCAQKLREREEALLAKLRREHRRLRRSLLAPKRMALSVNLNHQQPAPRMAAGEIVSGADDNNGTENGTTNANGAGTGLPPALVDSATTNEGQELEKMLPTVQRALKLAATPFHFTGAEAGRLRQFDELVDRLGTVYLGEAEPSRSIVNAHPALVLAESTAKVKGINCRGRECRGGGADMAAWLEEPVGGATTACAVTDCLNGVYKLAYTPQRVGRHLLWVTISGDAIGSCPLEVDVSPVRLLPSKALVGGACTVAMELTREYSLSEGKEPAGGGNPQLQRLSLQNLKIAILGPDGEDVEASVAGTVRRRGPVSVHTLRYKPVRPGFHEVRVSRLGLQGDGAALAQAVMPVADKEQIGWRGKGPAQFDNPTDVVLTADGDLLVADTVENERVQCLSPEGRHKYDFPLTGQEPTLLAANASRLAALLLNSKRVRVMTLEGAALHDFGHEGFVQPYGIALDSRGQVYVSDSGAHCVFVFEPEGRPRARPMGGGPGSGPGEFDFPNFVCVDVADNVLVSEAKNRRLQVFDCRGQCVREIRCEDRLPRPGALAVTPSGYLLVHNESDGRVQVLNLDTGRFVGSVLVDLIAPYTRRLTVTRTGFLVVLDMTSHCLWRYPIPFERLQAATP